MSICIGAVGLGRLGAQHALNLRFAVPGAELVALCDADANRLAAFMQRLNVPKGYTSFAELLDDPALDAVALSSPSVLHPTQIARALERGFHVFSEKPLGTTIEDCRIAERAVERHPQLVFMLGFMRRYDPSYVYAKTMLASGAIGKPILFRGYSQDPESAIDGAIAFAGQSGGQFIDMAVHDIDLARWFMNSEPRTIFAIGGCYAHPEFGQFGDGDNVAALLHMHDGGMAFLFAGRTAPHGYNVETEIIGTLGTLRIGAVPQKNMVEILDRHGVRKECSQDFIERFGAAYVNEMNEFVACIRERRKPEVTVFDGTRCTEIAFMCKEEFENDALIRM